MGTIAHRTAVVLRRGLDHGITGVVWTLPPRLDRLLTPALLLALLRELGTAQAQERPARRPILVANRGRHGDRHVLFAVLPRVGDREWQRLGFGGSELI